MDLLTCSATGSVDSDGNPVENHDFAFTEGTNRFPRSGQTSASVQVNQLFSPGTTVGCEARTNLGDPLPMVGEWVTSPEQATVLNTPPTLTSVAVLINQPLFNGSLIRCLGNFSDPDLSDFPTLTAKWFVNGALYTPPFSIASSIIFYGTDAISGDTVACELQVNDKFGGTSAWVRSPDVIVP